MKETTKYKSIAQGLSSLSLGISMVVAILLGVGVGIGLNKMFDNIWLLFLGIFWGVSASILNVYKAYKKQQKEFQSYIDEAKEVEDILNNRDAN
jgi:F0F1-type ATP synthase assembly protein I